MAFGSVLGVVWEWQRDDGGFSPYHPEVIRVIENAHKKGQNVLNLGIVSKPLTPYTVDLFNRTQTRTATGMVREIRRSQVHLSGTPCYGLWEWQDGSNNFNIYSMIAMIEIEEAYNLKQSSVDLSVKPSRLPYTIDFTTMYQTRHHFDTKRRIRRTTLPTPLQSYLASDTSSLAAVSMTPGATGGFSFENSAHSTALNSHSSSSTHFSAPGRLYTAPLSSVYPSSNASTTSSAFPQLGSIDTMHYKSLQPDSSFSTPGVRPNLYSATTTTSTHASTSPKKGHKGESSKNAGTTSVRTRSSGRAANKSVPTDVIDLTSGTNDKTTSKSTKRCKTKVHRPKTKG